MSLALVLDRSGSMEDEAKIGYLREAAHLVVDNLAPQDREKVSRPPPHAPQPVATPAY